MGQIDEALEALRRSQEVQNEALCRAIERLALAMRSADERLREVSREVIALNERRAPRIEDE